MLACQLTLLTLQLRTYWRTHHYSLRLVAIATLSGIAGLIVGAIPHFVRTDESTGWLILYATIGFSVVQMVVGIWGAVALFRSYIQLTEAERRA